VKAVAGLLTAIGVVLVLAIGASANNTDGSTPPSVDTSSAIVQLTGDPVSTYVKTKPARGKKIDFNSNTVKSYRAQLSAERNDFKQWLQANAPSAKITGQFDISVNAVSVQLNGTSLDTLRSAPQVQSASYEGLYHPTSTDPDLSLISAFDAWGGDDQAHAATAGAGVVVGVVDTGIDINNPCFSGTQKTGPYTNGKVLSAAVFYNKAANQHLDAAPVQDHGTHVAGTIACNFDTAASVNGAAIPYGISGVAPAAKLRSYNIFPGNVTDARDEDILNALDAAAQDGVDVINMSLGGDAHGIQDLLTNAVDNLDQANIVVAVAAGNSGPGHDTVESPGSAARALTAGAASVGHIVTAVDTSGGDEYFGDTGEFPTVSSDLTAPLKLVTAGAAVTATGLEDGCAASPAGSLANDIAVVSRGNCSFSQKEANARDAGALATLVVNNSPIAITMAQTAGFGTPIPTYIVSLAQGTTLAGHDGDDATIPAVDSYRDFGPNDQMADFSSQGPTDVDFRIKPDVVAPGVNVLSSIPNTFCGTTATSCFAFFQGTSMATPHLAGSAAVLISQAEAAGRPYTAEQIRSQIVNTADQNVLTPFVGAAADEATDVNVVGAGRENLDSAAHAAVTLDPVSVSFGSVPSGSGQSATQTVSLTSLIGPAAFTAQITGTTGTGVTFSASAGGDGTVAVTMSAAKGAGLGDHQATLRILQGDREVAHAALYVFIKQ